MKRVLLISANYAPEQTGIAPYSAGLAEHLAARGLDVIVLASMPHYPQWRIAPPYAGKLRAREERNGVDVRRTWQYVPRTQSSLARMLYDASSLLAGVNAVRLPRPDAVIGVVPPLGGALLARATAARFRVPYSLIVQDLVAPAITQSGIGGAGVAGVARAAERIAMSRAHSVAVVADGFRAYLERLDVPAERTVRVRNWVRPFEPPGADAREARRSLGLPCDAFVVLHAGNMGYKQGLENVIECARLASVADPRLYFALMGDGNQRATLESLATRYALPNLRFLPLQPDAALAGALAAADVLLVNQRASVVEMSLPSKLTSYFAAGRAVVSAVAARSETAHEIAASGGGVIVTPDDPAALLRMLRLLADQPALAADLGARGRRYATSALSAPSCLAAYDEVVDAMLAGSAAAIGRRRRGVRSPAANPVRGEVDMPADTRERRAA